MFILGNNIEINKQRMRNCFLVTFIVGMIAHGYVYLNSMYGHDSFSYSVSKDIINSIISGATRTTPFCSLWNIFMAECRTPWLAGIIILTMYSIASYYACETLEIRSNLYAAFVSAIMIVTPTTISGNTFAVEHVYGFVLAMACISAYLFFSSYKYSKIILILTLVLTVGSYGPFISTFFLLVLIRLYKDFLKDYNAKTFFKKIIKLVLLCSVVVAILLAFSLLVGYTTGVGMQGRVEDAISIQSVESSHDSSEVLIQKQAEEGSLTILLLKVSGVVSKSFSVFSNIVKAGINAFLFFLPPAVAKILGMPVPANSFFVENRILIIFFYASYILSIAAIVNKIIRNKEVFKGLSISIVSWIIAILAMDIYGSVTWPHLLMRYAFIIPWLFIIMIADMELKADKDIYNKLYKKLVYVLSVVTVISGVYLANEVYAKEEATYKSGLLLVNRVADHLEAVDGYIPGETKVYLIGNLNKYYKPVRDEFNFVRDITGAGSPYWDTSIPLYWSFKGFLDSQIAITINYAVTPDWYTLGTEDYAQELLDAGYSINKDEFIEKYDSTLTFPNESCYFWCGDILVFKLSDNSSLRD